MTNCLFDHPKRTLITLFFTAMLIPGFSQDTPEYDKFVTSAGVVELHFIGHGSLMFKLNSFVIYIDPVRSSGN